MTTTDKDARRASRRKRRRIGLLLLLALAAGATLAAVFTLGSEERLIALQRKHRTLLASVGMPMPGTPDLKNFEARLAAKGLSLGAPVFVRIFKREFELEVWMAKDGRYELFETYPICKWSGALGPKEKTGDRQAPEGFYSVAQSSLNPNSRWHRSFNLGFPNAFDRAHGRTGSFLMVHGGCGSVGCYAMTNGVIDEIWRLVTRALDGGQARFQVQVFPFRMTDANLYAASGRPWHAYWMNLKTGYDMFEADRVPPVVGVCGKSYAFASGLKARDLNGPVSASCPERAAAGATPPPG